MCPSQPVEPKLMRTYNRNYTALLSLLTFLLLPISESIALDKGDWLVRLRRIGIIPTDESGPISPDLLTS